MVSCWASIHSRRADILFLVLEDGGAGRGDFEIGGVVVPVFDDPPVPRIRTARRLYADGGLVSECSVRGGDCGRRAEDRDERRRGVGSRA